MIQRSAAFRCQHAYRHIIRKALMLHYFYIDSLLAPAHMVTNAATLLSALFRAELLSPAFHHSTTPCMFIAFTTRFFTIRAATAINVGSLALYFDDKIMFPFSAYLHNNAFSKCRRWLKHYILRHYGCRLKY